MKTNTTLKTLFFKTAELLFNLAKKTNDEGEYFPLWGTGLGFEAIIELIN